MHSADEKKWRTYEEVAAYLLDRLCHHFGLFRVEGKQQLPGQGSGTDWEIDAKGVKDQKSALFVLVECRRRTTSRLKQEDLAALAFRIRDTGAVGGIIVSPLELQVGARKVAESANIVEVTLSPEATTANFIMKFLNRILTVVSETVQIQEVVHCVLKPAEKNDGDHEGDQ